MKLLRTSPAYDAHIAAGAIFREKNGWHRVDYFAPNAAFGNASRQPIGPSADSWSPAIEAEHRATREAAGLFDLTSFGKIEVIGPGAGELLETVCANRVARGAGALTYTQMLNDEGGVVADITVGQLDDETFFLVTGTSALGHDLEWIRKYAIGRTDVVVRNVTSAWSCFGVWGPNAREILAPIVGTSLDSRAFPYMSIRESLTGGVPLRLCRVTFVGELGWEVYAPTEHGRALWHELSGAVESFGGLRCGYRSIDSLRAEKGYLYLGADILTEHSPYVSGLGAFVRPSKIFVGREALLHSATPTEHLVCLTLDDSWYLLQGGEQVMLSDGRSGVVTSAGLGYTIGSSVAFAMMPPDVEPGTSVQIAIEGNWTPATVVAQPLYDPTGTRIRA